MSDLIKIIFALLLPVLAGYAAISIIIGKGRLNPIEKFALSYITGCGIFSFSLFVMGMLRVPFSVSAISLPWLLALAAFFVSAYLRKTTVLDIRGVLDHVKALRKLEWYEWPFLTLIAFRVFYSFIESMIKPVWACDSFGTWSMKAKVFFIERGLSLSNYRNSLLGMGHTDYPNNIPLLETWISTALSRWDDQLIKIIFPMFFLSFIIVFYYSVRRFAPRFQSIIGTYLLTALPLLVFHSTIEYSDLPLSVFFCTAVFFFIRYVKERHWGDLIMFSMLSALAAWTKNEGLMLAFVNLLLLAAFMMTNKVPPKEKFRGFLAYITATILIALPWYIFRAVMGVPTYGDQVPHLGKALEYANRIPVIISFLFNKDLFYGHWEIAWFMFAVMLILSLRNFGRTENFYSLLAISLCFAALFFIYYLTNSYSFMLDGTAVNRNTLIFMPLLIFYITVNLTGKLNDR